MHVPLLSSLFCARRLLWCVCRREHELPARRAHPRQALVRPVPRPLPFTPAIGLSILLLLLSRPRPRPALTRRVRVLNLGIEVHDRRVVVLRPRGVGSGGCGPTCSRRRRAEVERRVEAVVRRGREGGLEGGGGQCACKWAGGEESRGQEGGEGARGNARLRPRRGCFGARAGRATRGRTGACR